MISIIQFHLYDQNFLYNATKINYISEMISEKTPKIRVLIRKRPLSKKQLQKGDKDIVQVQNAQSVVVREEKVKVDLTPYIDQYRFNFDGAYDENSTNQQIYQQSIKPLVECAFDGARVSCFAYGQTGSGKTFTMLGDGNQVYGLYVLAACDIFDQIVQRQDLQVWVSFYQIYCGKLFDLLNDRNVLIPREDAKNNVNIVGLSQRKITNVKNLLQTIQFGTTSRVTAQNSTNVDSSRSHAILQISLKKGKKIHGKISFIDLAGSERAADHADQVQKQTRIDGAQINKSLLALKQCIRALDLNKNHTPFRGSKLTMVLKDSFTGYCKTVMIGNISPNSSSSQNTLNTLKYADRVKQLKKPNRDASTPADQNDNFQDLNRELMLPRQRVNHREYKSSEKAGKDKPNNKSTLVATPKNGANNMKNNSYLIPQVKQNAVKSDGRAHKNSIDSDQFITKSQNKSKQNNAKLVGKERRQRINTMHLTPSRQNNQILIQQDEPEDTDQFLNFEQLGKRHQTVVRNLIKQQQQLNQIHSKHVDSTIELAKKQMKILGLTDDPEYNLNEYLTSLDQILEKQLQQLLAVRNKVHRVMNLSKQTEKIQQRYLEASNTMFVNQQEDILLDDDNRLFKN